MEQLISIPIVLLLTFIQISISGEFTILNGFADILLVWTIAWVIQTRFKHSWLWLVLTVLIMSFVSAMPWYAIFISYSIIFGMAAIIKNRLWQSPLLAFLIVLIIGSLIYYLFGFISLQFSGSTMQLEDSFTRIILPSIVMNLIIALPIYLITRDMILWLYPYKE